MPGTGHRVPSRATTRARGRARRRLIAAACTSLLALFLAIPASTSAANFTAGQFADLVLGASSYSGYEYDDGSKMTYGMVEPNGVAVDASGSVYVGDSETHRVTRWGTTPAGNGASFTNVLMKSGGSHQSWRFGCGGQAKAPEHISVVGDGGTTRLAIADRYNHRIILFTSEPTGDGTTGTVFLGQGAGNTCAQNRGGSAAANTLHSPTGVWTDGNRIAVADTVNNRVLLWNSWPTTGQDADVVLGQATFTDSDADRGGSAGRNTLDSPKGVSFDGSYLYVADSDNHRVLVWSGWPATSGADADYVIGQSSFTSSSTAGCNSRGVWYPVDVATTGSGAGHRIAVTSQYQHRVLVFTGFQASPASYPVASGAIGQGSIGSCGPNRNSGEASATSLRAPGAATFDGSGNLWVADTDNHRVLRFPGTATGTASNLVLGHAGATAMTSSAPMDGGGDNVWVPKDGTTMAWRSGQVPFIAPDGSLLVSNADGGDVTIWNGAPSSANEDFDVRLGQSERHHWGLNGPSDSTSASSLCDVHGTWTDGTRLLVADTCNDRVLAWTSMPTSDGQPADYVLGQVNFTNSASGTAQDRMSAPHGVTSDGTDVYVADTSNHRIIIFRDFWTSPSNGKAADVLLGQGTWTASSSGTSLTKLSDPAGIDLWDDRLVVADRENRRIVIWNDADSLTGGESIDAVVGQASGTARVNYTITDDVNDVAVEANALFWTEDCRAFVLDPIPTTGFVTAGATEIGPGCALAPSQNGVHSPSGIDAHDGRVWIASSQHGRLLRWTDTTAPTITVPPSATVRCDGTVTVTWTTSESTTTELAWDAVTRATWGAYANPIVDTAISGLTHSVDLSFATPGTRYARVRAVDWNGHVVTSGEIDFTVPSTCPAPTTMLGDDTDAQAGTGRANPSAVNAPPIGTTSFHTSWLNASGVALDGYQSQTWTTPPEHAGALYHLDASTAADANAAEATAMTWSGTASYEAGRFGQAASVSTTRYPYVADSPNLRKGNAFTVDAWFRVGSLGASTFPMVFSKAQISCTANERCNYALVYDVADSELCATVTTTAAGMPQRWACGAQGTTTDGDWHHAAITVDASNRLRLYVDGALHAGPVNMGAPATTGADPVRIGRAFNGNMFIGAVDEFRFSPVAYDAAAIEGYYRTGRPHAELLHDSATQPLGSTCSAAARCEDHVYGSPGAGVSDILRDGARYWQRARHRTLVNDYWSEWGVDWLETEAKPSISVAVGSAVDFGLTTVGSDVFGTSEVEVTMHGASGYQLLARDESDTWALERVGGGATIPDRQDGATAPAVWPASTPGFFGVTVRDATDGRLAKWGPGSGWPESDVTNNRYTGLESTSDVLLHERPAGPATDTVQLTWRVNPGLGQEPGAYDGVITLTAIASP